MKREGRGGENVNYLSIKDIMNITRSNTDTY